MSLGSSESGVVFRVPNGFPWLPRTLLDINREVCENVKKKFIEAAKTILYSLKEGDSVENMSKQQQLL